MSDHAKINGLNQSESSKKQTKSRYLIYCGCLFILIVIAAVLMWLPRIYHDMNLSSFNKSFKSLKHPANTSLIKHHKEVGLLIGNSDHIDYFIGELRSYSGTKNDIKKFYRSQTIQNPITDKRQKVELVFIDKSKPTDINIKLPYPVLNIADDLKQKHDQNYYYIIYVIDAGYDVSFDIRGM